MPSTTTNNASSKPQTSFLDLPGEIRNSVYRLALTSKPICPGGSIWRDPNRLSLLLTTHKIYKEASSILYSERRFMVELSPEYVRVPNLLTTAFPNANADPCLQHSVSRSPHHIILEFAYAAPCGCKSHLMSEDNFHETNIYMASFCATVLPRLTELKSIEVLWYVSTPVGDRCRMGEYQERTRECRKLLRQLARAMPWTVREARGIEYYVHNPYEDIEGFLERHERWEAANSGREGQEQVLTWNQALY